MISTLLLAASLHVVKRVPPTTNGMGIANLIANPTRPGLFLSIDWTGVMIGWDVAATKERWRRDTGLFGTRAAAPSPDGRFVLVADGQILGRTGAVLMDFDTGAEIRRLEGTADKTITALGFARDGRFTATATMKRRMEGDVAYGNLPDDLIINDTESGKLVRTIPDGVRNAFATGFSLDDAFVYALAGEEIKVWDATSGETIKSLQLADLFGEAYRACQPYQGCGPDRLMFVGAEFSPDMRFAAVGTKRTLVIVAMESLREVTRFDLPEGFFLRRLGISNDQETLYAFCAKSYNAPSDTALVEFDIPTKTVRRVVPGDQIAGMSGGGGEPLYPGATITFVNDHQNIVTGDIGNIHTPLRVPVSIWAVTSP